MYNLNLNDPIQIPNTNKKIGLQPVYLNQFNKSKNNLEN